MHCFLNVNPGLVLLNLTLSSLPDIHLCLISHSNTGSFPHAPLHCPTRPLFSMYSSHFFLAFLLNSVLAPLCPSFLPFLNIFFASFFPPQSLSTCVSLPSFILMYLQSTWSGLYLTANLKSLMEFLSNDSYYTLL